MTRWPPPAVWRGQVLIEPLTAGLVELDLAAYVSSPSAIERHSAGRWPVELSREEDLALIALHEAEHRSGTAFAYAILVPDGSRQIGCAYLRPLPAFVERTGTTLRGLDPSATAIVTFWLVDDSSVRPDEVAVVSELMSWTERWAAAAPVFRCLPDERSSVVALQALGRSELEAGNQELPYRWFV